MEKDFGFIDGKGLSKKRGGAEKDPGWSAPYIPVWPTPYIPTE